MGRLEGKVALITGAARGMGAAHARRFVAEGAKVVLTDVLDAEGEATAREIGGTSIYQHLDVSSEEEWAAAIAKTVETYGGLDILVNNSGIQRMGPIEEIPLDDFRLVMDINFWGTVFGVRAAVAPMRKAGGGSIVNIASVNGLTGAAHLSPYVSSKHAVVGFTKSAAMELGISGIRVNNVCPGPVRTPLTDAVNEQVGYDAMASLGKKLPVGRPAVPDEITGLVLFLASDESSYCTGSDYVVDGGLTAGLSHD